MGQSQAIIVYDQALLQALDLNLSSARMAPYIARAHGDSVYAYQLYLWNARLAKSFLYPLGIVEVSVRNSMHKALSAAFGTTDWILNPAQHYPYFNGRTIASHQVSKDRLIRAKGGAAPSSDEMVAGLNFDFWSNLLRAEYHPLWSTNNAIAVAFPLMQPSPDLTTARLRISEINHFRNRIAHHEPIHHLNLQAKLALLEETMNSICPVTMGWMKSCTTARQTLRSVPAKISSLPGPQLSSTNIRPPMEVDAKTKVTELLETIEGQRPQVALTRKENGEVQLITPSQIFSYLNWVSKQNESAILLEKETVAELVANSKPVNFGEIEATSTTGDAIAKFFPSGAPQSKRPQFLLVKSADKIVGVIQNPVVKY